MQPTTAAPTIASMRRLLYVNSALVLVIGIPLYLLSDQTDTSFAWTIHPPLTAAVLGAGYWASFALELLSARERLWARTRVAVPAVLLFSTLTLVITLVHAERFHFHSPQLVTRAGFRQDHGQRSNCKTSEADVHGLWRRTEKSQITE